MNDLAHAYLEQWTEVIIRAAQVGTLGKNVLIHEIHRIAGPRAGVLEIIAGVDNAGSHAGRMLRALTINDMALHRQLIPPSWRIVGYPAVYMSGHALRLEAGWPDELAERDIPLSQLGLNPRTYNPQNPVRWIVGKNELGHTITVSVSDATPHFLFGGMTGAGKTVAMRSAVWQMGLAVQHNPGAVQFVLIDGKSGAGLAPLAHIPGRIGPMVVDPSDAANALGWVLGEMKRRLIQKQTMNDDDWNTVPPVVVVIDEIQEITKDHDLNTQLLRQLAAQGREAKVHLLVGTQHPTLAAFGDDSSMKRNIAAGVIALRTADAKASEVVVGASFPDAHLLLGGGDAYAITAKGFHRTQVAYPTQGQMAQPQGPALLFEDWPEFAAEDAAGGMDGNLYTPHEMSLALLNAYEGAGRDALKERFVTAGLTRPGSPKAMRLRDYGRELLARLRGQQFDLVEVGKEREADPIEVL